LPGDHPGDLSNRLFYVLSGVISVAATGDARAVAGVRVGRTAGIPENVGNEGAVRSWMKGEGNRGGAKKRIQNF
jgi:hypothetical protein